MPEYRNIGNMLENVRTIGARILVAALLVCNPTVGRADITPTEGAQRMWDITGNITKADIPEVERILGNSKGTPVFRLNTPGGDVEAAIAIGRLLRRYQATAITYSQGHCLSACIYILIGAVSRVLSDTIGIHRPYSISTDQIDYQTMQARHRRLATMVKEYLEEMNVSPSLYEKMMTIPPEKMKILTSSELENYGIFEEDPVKLEIDESSEARRYKLTKIEYLTRKAEVNSSCARAYRLGSSSGDFSGYFDCREKIMARRIAKQ